VYKYKLIEHFFCLLEKRESWLNSCTRKLSTLQKKLASILKLQCKILRFDFYIPVHGKNGDELKLETCSYETPNYRASGYNLWWWDETAIKNWAINIISKNYWIYLLFFHKYFKYVVCPFWACWELQNIYVLLDKLFHSIIWTVKKYGLLCTRKMHCQFFF
jgi:hypothetical protein